MWIFIHISSLSSYFYNVSQNFFGGPCILFTNETKCHDWINVHFQIFTVQILGVYYLCFISTLFHLGPGHFTKICVKVYLALACVIVFEKNVNCWISNQGSLLQWSKRYTCDGHGKIICQVISNYYSSRKLDRCILKEKMLIFLQNNLALSDELLL